MSGITSTMGSYMLNTLTCNDGNMYNGSGTSYNIYNSVMNKSYFTVSNYGTSGILRSYRYEDIEVPSAQQSRCLIASEILDYAISNIVTPAITKSYLGLLVEKPQYYYGSTVLHPTLSLINRENPTTFQSRSFLNIHEIPNRDHNGLLSNASASDQHYWDGYARVCIGEIEKNGETGKYECSYTALTGAQVVDEYQVSGDNCWAESKLITQNTGSIFMGLNTSVYAWPAIKYFGLFRNASDSGNLYLYAQSVTSTNYYWIEESPDLYLWGELQEANNWYHLTEDDSYQSSKTYYTRSGSSPNYVFTEWTSGASGWVKANMYEKLGVIIEPDYGATFSPGAFKLIFENSTYEV